jgi:hypothetical protein
MITSELISYIRKQINNNIPKDLIISKLTLAGWHKEDIDEGFLSVEQELVSVAQTPKNEELKNEVSNIEIFNTELPVGEYPEVVTTLSGAPKIWTPMKAPIKEQTQNQEVFSDLNLKTEPKKEIEPSVVVPVEQEDTVFPTETENNDKKLEVINPKYFDKKEELIPTLIPKIKVDSLSQINTEHITPQNNPVTQEEKVPIKNSIINNLPQSAMLSSYESDLMSINKTREEVLKKKGSNTKKWTITLAIVIIVGGLIWLFVSGHINIKNWKIPFIKEDPKVLLLNNSKVLASLKSYKTETNIEISSPSFANISAGLSSGEAVVSEDKDSVSIKTISQIDHENNDMLSSNSMEINSSIVKDPIITNIKNNGSDLFISMENPSQIIDDSVKIPTTVKINKDQFNLLPSLFSPEIEAQLNKINTYSLLSSGMPSFINNETLSIYDEFINNVAVIEKGQENIKGIDTYHYSINPDKQLSKKLLSKIFNNFILNVSSEDKTRLTEILGSTNVDSFDVWIGKGDNNIYQYNVVLNIPLSKIIDFQDKSIGNNLVTINWKTTYYDFNIPNKVLRPDTYTEVVDFVNNIKETRIKKEVDSFKGNATTLKNAEGVFGSKSNLSGSCMSPTVGSLFSPTGHTKGSTTAVSSISDLLNKIMGITKGAGSCYSTPKAWSFTVPISDNYDLSAQDIANNKYYYCVDNNGAMLELINSPAGVVCK